MSFNYKIQDTTEEVTIGDLTYRIDIGNAKLMERWQVEAKALAVKGEALKAGESTVTDVKLVALDALSAILGEGEGPKVFLACKENVYTLIDIVCQLTAYLSRKNSDRLRAYGDD